MAALWPGGSTISATGTSRSQAALGSATSRPGQLRETIRRKANACSRDGSVRIEVVQSPGLLGPAVAAYEEVYRRSWKAPEAAPGFTGALLPRAARAGVLRLGVMWVGEQPVAAQYWTVADGTATVLKLAHDDAWRSLSPGTVLTAHMIRKLLANPRDPRGLLALARHLAGMVLRKRRDRFARTRR